MRSALVLLATTATLTAAPVPKDFKKTDDKVALVGLWKVNRLTINGRADQNLHTHTFGFDAEGNCHTLFGQNARSDWTFTLDPTASPKRMNWVAKGGGSKWVCVYEVAGDTLKVGFVAQNVEPPATVEPGPTLTLYEMTRMPDSK